MFVGSFFHALDCAKTIHAQPDTADTASVRKVASLLHFVADAELLSSGASVSSRVRVSRNLLSFTVSLLAGLSPLQQAHAADKPFPDKPFPDKPFVSATVPNRYLLVYRNGQIPGDAEARMGRIGARLAERHERFGIASVMAPEASASQLARDPAVEYVVQDRVVTAHRVLTAPLLRISDTAFAGRTQTPLPAIPKRVLPVPLPGGPSASTGDGSGSSGSNGAGGSSGTNGSGGSTSTTNPAPVLADRFYTATPQGWAVKAVGGFGKGVLGGVTAGPWNSTTGKDVRIAVLDSGVDATHPDIAPNLALNLSEIDQTAQPSPCDDGTPQDQQGHGTWVASLAAGAMGTDTGSVVGVAPSATLLNIKVLQRMPGDGATTAAKCASGQAAGLVSWLLKGIDDAVQQHADIIVLSLGSVVDLYTGDGAGLKASFDRVTHAAAAAGVVIVAAAGNEGFDLTNPRYLELPAQARDVLAVVASTNPDCAENNRSGATCAAGPVSLPYYSNYGAPLNAIAAPGGNYPVGADEAVSGWVRGACSSGRAGTADGLPDANHSEGCFNLGHQEYVQAMGTSASAPLAGGVAALVRAAHPNWDSTTVINALRGSAKQTSNMIVGAADAAAALAFQP